MKWLLTLGVLLWSVQAHALERHTVSGLSFEAPAGAEVTRHTLAKSVDSVAVTYGEQGLVFVQYSGAKMPSEKRALTLHLEELEVRLLKTSLEGSLEVKKDKISIIGRSKVGRRLTYVQHYAGTERRYIAKLGVRRVRGMTLVVLWTSPFSEDSKYFAPELLQSLQLSGSQP